MAWLWACERAAYGLCALKPWEFWRMTPREFELVVAGALWRTERAIDLSGGKSPDREFGESSVPGYRKRRP